MSAYTQLPELITALMGYFGEIDDPTIGWCAPNPSSKDLFKCEKCGAEHRDCFQIRHIKNCRAVRLRDAYVAAVNSFNAHCQCEACRSGAIHASDCAVHNEPAMPNGACDCDAITQTIGEQA